MPRSPYTDLDRPPLDARRLRQDLVTPDGLWTRLELRVETGSTNADVATAARSGESEGLVVVAERQTAGRGRRDRAWESPPRAGIATSVLLRPGVADPARGWPAVPPAGYGWLSLLAGVALVGAVTRLAELPAWLKWPNDLLVPIPPAAVPDTGVPTGSRAGVPTGSPVAMAKCAGILAEVVPGTVVAAPPAIVLGVGLNVTLRADELPVNPTGLPATSLQLAGAVATDRGPLLRAVLRGIAGWYERWRAAGGDSMACGLHEAYLAHCATIGRDVRVLLPGGGELLGRATTIDSDGRLVLRTVDGEHRVAAGDVLHLREPVVRRGEDSTHG